VHLPDGRSVKASWALIKVIGDGRVYAFPTVAGPPVGDKGLKRSLVGVAKGAGRKLPFSDKARVTEVNKTLDRIDSGGPFPYKKDGTVFKNREGALPKGNYREYTVDTPGASNRGARRVVRDVDSGRTYYTDDHYRNFIQIDPKRY